MEVTDSSARCAAGTTLWSTRVKRTVRAQCAVLIVASSLGACGGEESTTAAIGAPAEGRYIGETSQGLPISFIVTGGTVRDIRFGWRARCADGEIHSNTIALPGGAIHDGAFSSGGGLETGGIAHVAGRFDEARVSGDLSRHRGSAFGTNCRAAGISWSADLFEAESS